MEWVSSAHRARGAPMDFRRVFHYRVDWIISFVAVPHHGGLPADANCERVVALWWRTDQPRSPAVEAVRDAICAVPPPHWPWSQPAAARGQLRGQLTPQRR